MSIEALTIYCESCGEHRSFILESLGWDATGKTAYADIVCAHCHFVIATFGAEKPGELAIIGSDGQDRWTTLVECDVEVP